MGLIFETLLLKKCRRRQKNSYKNSSPNRPGFRLVTSWHSSELESPGQCLGVGGHHRRYTQLALRWSTLKKIC